VELDVTPAFRAILAGFAEFGPARRSVPSNLRTHPSGENRWVRLRISNAALRLIDKVGVDQVVADLRAKGAL